MPSAPVEAARAALGLSVVELWRECIALTGRSTLDQLAAYLAGQGARLPDIERDVVVQALNEEFSRRGLDERLAYRT